MKHWPTSLTRRARLHVHTVDQAAPAAVHQMAGSIRCCGSVKSLVERNQLGTEPLGQPEIAGVVDAQARFVRQPEGGRHINFHAGDVHLSEQAQAVSSASLCAGCRRTFFRQTLAISISTKVGANRLQPSSWLATRSAVGSPNSSAASAEASATLTGIALSAQQFRSFGRCSQPHATDLREHLQRRQVPVSRRCIFLPCLPLGAKRAPILVRLLYRGSRHDQFQISAWLVQRK